MERRQQKSQLDERELSPLYNYVGLRWAIEKDIAERPVACGSQTDSPNAAIQVRVPQAASRKRSPSQPPWRDLSTPHLWRILRDVLDSSSFPSSIVCLERVDVDERDGASATLFIIKF
jgi:hypothetical protein